MASESTEPGDESPRFNVDPDRTRRMVDAAFHDEQQRRWGYQVLFRALGSTSLECSDCGEFCPDQAVLVRDAIFSRASQICEDMMHTIDVYRQNRDLGIIEPEELITMVYRHWGELSCLHLQAEPQSTLDEEEEG